MNYELFALGAFKLTIATLLGLGLVWASTWFFLRVLNRLINRARIIKVSDQGRRHSLFLIVQYIVWTTATVVMLEVVGIRVSVLLAGSAALLVGLGLGVQQIFRDIMSGIFLLFEGTIEVGDILQLDGQVSRVAEINLRTSKLITRDGVVLIIPNHKFITENVVNWTHRENDPARFSVLAGADYQSDEVLVRQIMLECAADHADVLKNDDLRAPTVRLTDFADERMIFDLQFWTSRKFEVEVVRSELRFEIRKRFREAGIVMHIPPSS
jgi:small-conductance mechanosensitive channel